MKHFTVEKQTLGIGELFLNASADMPIAAFRALDEPLKSFVVSAESGDFILKVLFAAPPATPDGPPLLISRSNWELRHTEGKYPLHWSLMFPAAEPPLQRVFVTNDDFTSGELYIPPGKLHDAISPFSYLLSEIIVTGLMARCPGLLPHASAVIYKNRAYLFAGESGAGKSTIAELLARDQDFRSLSDERNLLRPMEEIIYCYGTPWPGTSGLFANFSAPLAAVFFLAHGPKHVAHPLSPAEAVERLLLNAALPVWSPAGVHKSLDFAARIAENIPCLSLEFAPENSIADFIRRFADSQSKGTSK